MGVPTSAHFIYIPAVLILGLVLGFIWGARLTREAIRLEQRGAEERAARQAKRAARAAGEAPPAEKPPA
jgi:hypothetical protein